MNTKTFRGKGKFAGTLEIWEVDEDGEKQVKRVRLGKRNFKTILDHIEEIKAFVEEE